MSRKKKQSDKMLVLFVGSGYRSRDKFLGAADVVRRHFSVVEENVVTLPGTPDAYSTSVQYPNVVASSFSEWVTTRGDTVVWAVDGGTGAARVARYWRPGGDATAVVCGGSDSFLYPLMAYMWGSEDCFYTPNLSDGAGLVDNACREILGFSETGIEVHFPNAYILTRKGLAIASKYTSFPVCTGPFTQIQGTYLYDEVQERLTSKPHALMLEDNYPQDDPQVARLALYEDLTRLQSTIENVQKGGGILSFSHSPGCEELVREVVDDLRIDITTVVGINFGHGNNINAWSIPVIRFGSTYTLNDLGLEGIRVELE